MRRVSETATSSVANNHTSSINSIDIHQMPKKPRKLDFWNVIPENKVISDHVEERKKECMRPKSSQDNAKIKQLMKVTYNKRRSNILTSATLVHEIVQEFPPLATIHGIRHEFGRVMEDENLMKASKERFSKHRIAMVKYCERKPRKTPFLKQALQLRKEAIFQEPEKIQEIESKFAVMVLPNLLFRNFSKQKNKGHQEDKADDYQHIYNILNKDEDLNAYVQNVTFPSLIGIGENMFTLDHLYLCVEGKVLVEVTGFPIETVFFTLYATFYIFSIAYSQQYIDFSVQSY